jgi:hypothetical protein
MMGETMSRRSPNNLQLALRECEALITGPAKHRRREGFSSVLPAASFGHSLTDPDSSCDRSGKSAYDV